MLQQLAPIYIATGKVRLVYINYPILGPESGPAAEAAECAADQNKFWVYGNYLFTHQNGENQGAFATNNLKKFASDLGLNTQEFNSCLDSGKYASLVQQQYNQGQAAGITSTPTFFINGTKYAGSMSYDQWVSALDQALAAATSQPATQAPTTPAPTATP